MKKLIIGLAFLASCTKVEPTITAKAIEPSKCPNETLTGRYYSAGFLVYNWKLCDTMNLSFTKDSFFAVFPEQTRSNGFEIKWLALRRCKGAIPLKSGFTGNLIAHVLSTRNDTLFDFIVNGQGDTLGTKYFKRF